MQSYLTKDTKNELGKLLDEAQASPVMIHKHCRVSTVVMSAAKFETDSNIWDGFNREFLSARQHAEKLAYEVQSLKSLVAKLEADHSWHRDLVEKLRHFVPPGADAFHLDVDEKKVFSLDKSEERCKTEAAQLEQVTSLPTFATTQPTPDEKPPLTGHDLATPEGRREFLITFYEFHQEAGLLMAVNYVWGYLNRPKAVFCKLMAQRLGLGGQGKTALRYVLQKFLHECFYDSQVPDWPQQEDFPDFASYNAETLLYHERLDREFGQIIDRWEAILDGRDPDQPKGKCAEIIKGPWGSVPRIRTSKAAVLEEKK